MARNMEKVFFIKINIIKDFLYGEMGQNITEISLKIIYKDMVNIIGRMEEYIKENGLPIKCMEKDYLPGVMVKNTKESI